jgi:hypothetical protein
MNFEDKILKAKEFDTEILTKLKEICEILYVFRGKLICDSNIFNGHISFMEIKNDIFTSNITYYNNIAEFDTVTCNVPLKYFNMTEEELINEKIGLGNNDVSYGGINISSAWFSQIRELESRIDSLVGIINSLDC